MCVRLPCASLSLVTSTSKHTRTQTPHRKCRMKRATHGDRRRQREGDTVKDGGDGNETREGNQKRRRRGRNSQKITTQKTTNKLDAKPQRGNKGDGQRRSVSTHVCVCGWVSKLEGEREQQRKQSQRNNQNVVTALFSSCFLFLLLRLQEKDEETLPHRQTKCSGGSACRACWCEGRMRKARRSAAACQQSDGKREMRDDSHAARYTK